MRIHKLPIRPEAGYVKPYRARGVLNLSLSRLNGKLHPLVEGPLTKVAVAKYIRLCG
jgi:hypothetical protein